MTTKIDALLAELKAEVAKVEAETASRQTARLGTKGGLRNLRAMADRKFNAVVQLVLLESNDPDAADALRKEIRRRDAEADVKLADLAKPSKA